MWPWPLPVSQTVCEGQLLADFLKDGALIGRRHRRPHARINMAVKLSRAWCKLADGFDVHHQGLKAEVGKAGCGGASRAVAGRRWRVLAALAMLVALVAGQSV